MNIVVIGAGVVGLSTAWRLLRDGHRVTVVDSAAGPGLGASRANGGQLSYSYVAPLAGPSVWRDLPRLLYAHDAPVRLRLGLDPWQYRWCLRFLAACSATRARRTTETLLRLAATSRAVLHEARELRGIDFAWGHAGKLVVYSDACSLAAACHQAEFQNSLGGRQHVLGREACLALEPALASIAHRLAGGVFAPDDESGDAHLLCRGLADWLRHHGATLLTDVAVHRLARDGRRLLGVETDRGVIEADAYVLAAGLGSRALARDIGLDLPLYPIKGYSLSVDIEDDASAPRVSLTDQRERVVYARLGGVLRIAGMADIVGDDATLDAARVAQLARQARAVFPTASAYRILRPWAGLRPATPTGLPIVGATQLHNLLVNVGHGALGFTLAFGAAEQLAAGVRDGLSLRESARIA